MTGGEVIVPIRGTNNEIISLATTNQTIKKGLFQKIIHALELGKKCFLYDVYIGSSKCTPIPVAGYRVTTSAGYTILDVPLYGYAADATMTTLSLQITNEDATGTTVIKYFALT